MVDSVSTGSVLHTGVGKRDVSPETESSCNRPSSSSVSDSIHPTIGKLDDTGVLRITADSPAGPTALPIEDRVGPFFCGAENALLLNTTIAGQPAYNPIFFHGPTGVGKSHLLHLVVERCGNQRPAQTACYITAVDFARELQASHELDTVSDFRRKMRHSDLLAIDDLQELAERMAAQIELLHTIDELVNTTRQIYIASRRSLSELDWLLPSLKSRLSGGLVVPLVQPSAAARRAIIDQLSNDLNICLDEDVLELLAVPTKRAARCTATISQLSNVLMELAALQTKVITPGNLRAVLDQAEKGVTIAPHAITKKTARYFQLKVADLRGPSRKHNIVVARSIAVFLMRKLSNVSLEKIGQQLGDRDHSTVLHAYRKIENSLAIDPTIRKSINEITSQLGSLSTVE